MYTGRLISSDDHVFEPIDLWTTRTDKAYLDRAPHIVREPEEDWWVCGEQKLMSLGPGTQTGLRFEDPEKIRFTGAARKHPKGRLHSRRADQGHGPGRHRGRNLLSQRWPLPLQPPRFRPPHRPASRLQRLGRRIRGRVPQTPQGRGTAQRRRYSVSRRGAHPHSQAGPRRRHDHHLSHGRPQLPPPRLRALVGGGGRPGHAARLALRDQPPPGPASNSTNPCCSDRHSWPISTTGSGCHWPT